MRCVYWSPKYGAPSQDVLAYIRGNHLSNTTQSKQGPREPQPLWEKVAAGLYVGGLYLVLPTKTMHFRGNHLSNTTCLMHIFFKRGECTCMTMTLIIIG